MLLGRTEKQFLLYYSLFFICLVILFIPLYQINLSMVSQVYLETAEKLLETGLSNFENDLGQIEAIAREVYNNPQFRRLSYLGEEPDLIEYYYIIPLLGDFNRYFSSMGMIADCGIIYENGMILTNKRLYFPEEQFYGYYFRQDEFPFMDQWLNRMPQGYFQSGFLPLSSFTTLEGPYDGITFCISFPGASLRGSFFFATFEKNYILSRLAIDEVLTKGRLIISDPLGNTVIDSSPQNLDGTGVIDLDITGQKRGVQVSIEIPKKIFQERLDAFRRMSLIFALAYLSLGIALSVFFAQRSAKPIREIVEEVLGFGDKGLYEDYAANSYKSDYNFIKHFLSRAESDLKTFGERMARQEESQRENLFERLLYGLVYSDAAYQAVREYFPDFSPPFRIAAVVLPAMEEADLSAYTVRQTVITDLAAKNIRSGLLYTHFSGNILVVLLSGKNDAEETLKNLKTMIADLQNMLNIRCKAALSEPVYEIRDIHQAFYSVRHLLRLPSEKENDIILQKEHIDSASFPIELLDASRLYEFLLHGEGEKAATFINTTFYEICRQGYSAEDDVQQVFFLYRKVLIQIMADLSLDIPGEEIIPAYDSRQDLSFLFAHLAESAQKICSVINFRLRSQEKEFEGSVIAYIDGNITNPGLYTKMATAFFRISENRLQSIMRKWTGKSFLEYVESKRMELSWEKLVKTDLPISRITTECGYSNENSFYKAFRRFYKISPSNVRMKNKN